MRVENCGVRIVVCQMLKVDPWDMLGLFPCVGIDKETFKSQACLVLLRS